MADVRLGSKAAATLDASTVSALPLKAAATFTDRRGSYGPITDIRASRYARF